jgi:hypothetical protein
VNALKAKGKILLRGRELLASSFGPGSCGEKTTVALKALAAPISPLIPLNTLGRVAISMNRDRRNSDESVTV